MLRYTRWLAIGLAMLFAAASSVSAQSIPFSDIMIFGQLTRAGVPMNSKLAVIGVPKGDLQTSPAQRDAIDARLASTLPPDFRYLSRNQLIRVANLIGSGDRVSDDIWANIQSDDPDVVGLVFFDPTSVQGGTAVVTPRIVLRDGQSIIFDPVTVALPETAYEIRLDALLAQFANRLSGIAPASKSLHVSFIQEGLAEPATSFRDCRNVLATRLKKEIATADTARLSSEHRAFVDKAKANLAVTGHLATEGETIFVGLEAPTIGLFEPIQSVKLGSSCILATAKPSCEHGTADDGSCLSKRQVAANELPSENTIPAWKAYLATCNGCQFEDLASFALQSLERRESEQREAVKTAKQAEADRRAWERAKATNTAGAIRFYLSSCGAVCAFKNHAVAWLKRQEQAADAHSQALREKDEKAWETALSTNTAKAYRTYLSSCYDTCLHAAEAGKKLAGLEAQREAEIAKMKATDERAWRAAKKMDTANAYKVYIATCVGPCEHRAEAEKLIRQKERQDEIARKAAVRQDDKLWERADEVRTAYAASVYLSNCSVCRHEQQAQSIVAIWEKKNNVLMGALVRSKKDTSGDSQYAICRAFHQGIGISKNLFYHVPWCEEAAKYNHPKALDIAGSAYMFGKGIAKDYDKAAAYLTRGALLGNKWAGYHLSQLYREGKGVSRDLDTAEVLAKEFVAHFYDKKSSGKTVTMYDYYEVATLYRDGFGVFKDRAKAREYFEKAKKLWHPQAADELSKLGK